MTAPALANHKAPPPGDRFGESRHRPSACHSRAVWTLSHITSYIMKVGRWRCHHVTPPAAKQTRSNSRLLTCLESSEVSLRAGRDRRRTVRDKETLDPRAPLQHNLFARQTSQSRLFSDSFGFLLVLNRGCVVGGGVVGIPWNCVDNCEEEPPSAPPTPVATARRRPAFPAERGSA